MRRLNRIEWGTVIGFIVGLIMLGFSWSFNWGFDAKFCIGEVCIRYAATLPLILAVLGLIIGFVLEMNKGKTNSQKVVPPRINPQQQRFKSAGRFN